MRFIRKLSNNCWCSLSLGVGLSSRSSWMSFSARRACSLHLLPLHLCDATSFLMDILDLFGGAGIERPNLLPERGSNGLGIVLELNHDQEPFMVS